MLGKKFMVIVFINWFLLPNGHSMNNFSYLRKLGLHIKGITPEDSEYANLALAEKEGRIEEFFEQILDHYLSSSRHINKMDYRLSELYWLDPSPFPEITHLSENRKEKHSLYHFHNSLNSLFREIISSNKPWDNLLVAKEFEITGPGTFHSDPELVYFYSDFGHFGALRPDKIPSVARGLVRKNMSQTDYIIGRSSLEKMRIIFEPHDLRVAGSLTTTRFMQRYSTSNANNDRRRAQAIYRIFLCDPMNAVTLEQGKDEGPLYKMYLADKNSPAKNQSQFSHHENVKLDIHGQDKACMSCHQKLDPVGKVYRTSSVILSPIPSPGALVLTNIKGEKEVIEVQGIGELAEVITRRKEYLACQVSHFWKWFIGENVPLNDEIQETLIEKFEEVGRRPNDFIKYLVKRSEFKSVESFNHLQTLSHKAKKILQNCNSCHLHIRKNFISYDKLFESELDTDLSPILSKIYQFLDLEHDGKNAKMPPSWSKEKLSLEEIQHLKNWIAEGAPNSEGKMQITNKGN